MKIIFDLFYLTILTCGGICMNYDAELCLLTDTLKKYGLSVVIADLSRPPAREHLTGQHLLQIGEKDAAKPLRELLPPVSPATVYTLTNQKSCYI